MRFFEILNSRPLRGKQWYNVPRPGEFFEASVWIMGPLYNCVVDVEIKFNR